MSLTVRIRSVSHTGLKRKNNEDMILIGDQLLRNGEYESEIAVSETSPVVFAVADGMGGHKSGDLASQYVAEGMRESVKRIGKGKTNNEVKEYFENEISLLHTKLMEKSESDPGLRSMGSTLVSIVFYENRIFLINAGDSRCYRFRNGILRQFSNDHSLSAITGIERKSSKALINSVGGGKSVFIDFIDVTPSFTDGDTIVLCSDGLHDMVEDDAIEKTLTESEVCEPLLQAALDAGGADNISIILLKLFETKKES